MDLPCETDSQPMQLICVNVRHSHAHCVRRCAIVRAFLHLCARVLLCAKAYRATGVCGERTCAEYCAVHHTSNIKQSHPTKPHFEPLAHAVHAPTSLAKGRNLQHHASLHIGPRLDCVPLYQPVWTGLLYLTCLDRAALTYLLPHKWRSLSRQT